MKAAVKDITMFVLTAASIVVVPLSLATTLFSLATAAGEPQDQSGSMMSAGMSLAIASGICATWITIGYRQKKVWWIVLMTPFVLLFALGTVWLLIGASGV